MLLKIKSLILIPLIVYLGISTKNNKKILQIRVGNQPISFLTISEKKNIYGINKIAGVLRIYNNS